MLDDDFPEDRDACIALYWQIDGLVDALVDCDPKDPDSWAPHRARMKRLRKHMRQRWPQLPVPG